MTLAERVEQVAASLIPAGSAVLCAVSGGADSVCMLHVLHSLSARHDWRISVAHVNHALRGAESDRDEAFVKSLCDSLAVPFYAQKIDVAALSAARHQGIEETARDVRYAFFHQVMEAQGIKILATAHTAKDNLETALYRFARGTGTAGLAGIPLSRPVPGGTVVRPLLSERREEIEAYLLEHGISHVTDSSNLEEVYTRNRIRHRILPELLALNPSLYDTAAQTLRTLRQDADFIESAADAAYRELVRERSIDAAALAALHPAVSGRLILRLYRETAPEGRELTVGNIAEVLSAARSDSPSACAVLPGGVTARREYERLSFQAGQGTATLISRTLTPGETTDFPEAGFSISCRFTPNCCLNLQNIQKFYFDSSHICGILSVRARVPGDRIHLAGHDHSKSVKKALIDARVPRDRRDLVPVICDEAGIAAVGGMGTAKRLAVTDATESVLVLEINYSMEEHTHDDRI
ncbi:MAG: tRNA lysidine(34) synthetase TilS [Ruminococcaceae bacterium]|nr:tRNA lysidine(34) synthetase TilS [Oscillospiraceae bacterium]